MKFNIEVEIQDIYEDGSLDEIFMDALKQELSYKVADILAKDAFQNLIKNPDIEAVKEAYTKALRNLEKNEEDKINQIHQKIKDVFTEFLNGTAYKINRWGEKTQETTVGELIREEVQKGMNDVNRGIHELITKEIQKNLQLDDYKIKELVRNETEKLRQETTKQVLEYIAKEASKK